MKRLSLFIILFSLSLILMNSCAYVQTHKQVEEWGCTYDGKLINNDNSSTWNIYRCDGKWYLPAQKVTLTKDYPTIKDTILFTGNNTPEYAIKSDKANISIAYHPISAGTAEVLMRSDGYAILQDLAEEIKATPGEWRDSLPGASKYTIKAQIDDRQNSSAKLIAGQRTPAETPVLNDVLSKLDFVVVDVPGTVIYNVAIPIMAPIKFFSEFLSND